MSNEVINAEVGGNFVLPPAGNQAAVCVGLTVMGTLEESYEGHLKKQKKVMLSFELTNTNHVFDEKKGPEPFLMHKEFTLSLGAKANLRKCLNEWSGSKFTDEDAKAFNLADLVGGKCFVNVVHSKNTQGKDQASIIAVAKVPEGIETPANRTPLKIFNINKQPFQTEIFQSLPNWIQKKIQSSDEYKALAGASSFTQPAAQTNQQLAANPFGSTTTVNSESVKKLF